MRAPSTRVKVSHFSAPRTWGVAVEPQTGVECLWVESEGSWLFVAPLQDATSVSATLKQAHHQLGRGTSFERDDLKIQKWVKRGLPVAVCGTPFQIKVWKQIQKIPAGQTATYAELAQRVGHPRATRAVGTAVGKNPCSILIPCHRIVPKNGGTGEYRWGKKMKSGLLSSEQIKKKPA